MSSSENIRAILLMTAGMAAASAGDAIVKALSLVMSGMQTAVVGGIGMFVISAIAAWHQGAPVFSRETLHWTVVFRTVFEVLGVIALILALAHVPLGTVTVLLQCTPLIVTLGAVLWFREPATTRDWLVLLVGFLGMLFIIRPDSVDFSFSSLLAVLAVILLSLRDLASRATPRSVTTTQLGMLAGAALCIAGILATIANGTPVPPATSTTIGLSALLVISAGLTFFCITSAMRIGDVSQVSPYRYTRLVFGIGLGVLFFDERPDATMLIGAAIITATGLFTWQRQRAR